VAKILYQHAAPFGGCRPKKVHKDVAPERQRRLGMRAVSVQPGHLSTVLITELPRVQSKKALVQALTKGSPTHFAVLDC
jgi:hypothetical protein